MYSEWKYRFKNMVEKSQLRFRKGITTRGALGISLILHLFIGMAFASFLAGKYYVEHITESSSIEFDLVTDTEVKFQSNTYDSNLSDQPIGQKLQNELQTPGFNGSESSAAGRESSIAKNNNNNKAVVLASLASLSELKDSFNFIIQKVSADSLTGFSPIQGKLPETEFYTAGFNGNGFGNDSGVSISLGGGGGHCPVGGIFR